MTMTLQRVDSVEIITLVDNVIENTGSKLYDNVVPIDGWVSKENTSSWHTFAGHGLATLIRTHHREDNFEVLYDTGPSGEILLHNVKSLGLDLSSVDDIVMSHGHWDHFGGLTNILVEIGRQGVPVYIHPRMSAKRRIITKTDRGEHIRELQPVCSLSDIKDAGGDPRSTTEPILIAGNTILRTGEIPRKTIYEKGIPNHQAFVDGEWVDDSKIIDDNCLAIETKRGLIIVTGCAHAGVVNSINEVIRLTGVKKVNAIIGGFHLAGKQSEPRIESTIRDLQEISPSMIVPCHCTGAVAQHMMAEAFPKAYVTSSVGNLYRF
jgi:7,8-dihydropterin-6-yl-methyl-4-(beta-D-ribofuranosyl)aminobenzene 5'-phosphate synthase